MGNLMNSYYLLKPLIPRRLQLFIRRVRANYIARKYKDIWPIDENCVCMPRKWSGWPGGKKFCVVLSHDVDTQIGHDRVQALIALEKSLGFKSAYNFVPERYNLSLDLVQEVKAHGFGIAVHGLKHDGKLFSNIKIFKERSKKINQYMKDWGTRGFTAPAMIHNLDWMYMLDIDYATTTFDTDPIEPQPEGAGTIFPYWVSEPCENGSYVELPYTLPQDFSLYITLREKNINIWKDKLKWLADHGGMVLLNSHPDYMYFGDGKMGLEEYPVAFYSDFLKHIKEQYKDQYWLALPEDVAKHMRDIHQC